MISFIRWKVGSPEIHKQILQLHSQQKYLALEKEEKILPKQGFHSKKFTASRSNQSL
jgi:hypothetical protein